MLGGRGYSVTFVIHKTKLETYEGHTMSTPHHPTAAVRRALRKLGADMRDARKRRRLPMSVIADRAFTSRATLQRIEAGDPGVGLGIYAAALNALGLLDDLANVADVSRDTVGMSLAAAELPERARSRRPRKASNG